MVDTFIEEGFRMIIMGDFNQPLEGQSRLEQRLRERGIEDKLRKHYPGQAPNTHKRGSKPIDGIFASELITILKGGWEGGMDKISNH